MASNFVVNVLGPREVVLQWDLPHPIDVFTEGNVTHEVTYRIKPFRNMYQNSSWIKVRLIFSTFYLSADFYNIWI